MSLSSRRAWIEIQHCCKQLKKQPVALLAESVDWNDDIGEKLDKNGIVALLAESVDWNGTINKCVTAKASRSPRGERGLKLLLCGQCPARKVSLSSRRAWIEISLIRSWISTSSVALLAESVDWNLREYAPDLCLAGRSPRGERGLKFRQFLFLNQWF